MSLPANGLQAAFTQALDAIAETRGAFNPELLLHEVGMVTSVATGVAKVSGLPSVGFEELVRFPGGVLGIAFNVDED